MKIRNYDYMKYWRVIRYYYKKKTGLTEPHLDLMFFLYSEDEFSKMKFEEFDTILGWKTTRFNDLLRDGWITVFRERKLGAKKLYELSPKGKRLINTIYKKMNGEEIPLNLNNDNVFHRDKLGFNDKRYIIMIKNMNAEVRKKWHDAHSTTTTSRS
jgi:hypothetical protein